MHKNLLPARLSRRLLILSLLIVATLLIAGCGLIGGDDEDDPPDISREVTTTFSPGDVRVIQGAMSRTVNDTFQATGVVSRVFPLETQRIYAILVLEGGQVGQQVNGRWYQLSLENSPPEGSFVSEANIILTQDNLTQDGFARVALDLGTNDGTNLPAGDWVVRIDVNGKFIRTLGFVISQFVAYPPEGSQPPPSATPGGQPPAGQTGSQPAPTATQTASGAPTPTVEAAPEIYQVVSGDTLTNIAERFKPANESAEAYVQRLREANDLEPGDILEVGQSLTLPGAP